MKYELKCKICKGIIMLSIVAITKYPICSDCSEKIHKYPDLPVEQRQNSITRQIIVGGISASVLSTDSDTSFN